MRKLCKVTLNEDAFLANCGELLLDSALMNGVDMPHDCRSGVCGACRVRLVDGKVFGGTEEGSDMIHACQARIVSDLKLVSEPVPEVVSLQGRVARLDPLAADVVGVSVEIQKPLTFLPGQFCKLQFRGFPERCYSPSYPLEGAPNREVLHFQIRRFPDGAVSSELGGRIRIGHRMRLTGPLGHAFFRPNHRGRVVLVASGTGFAPMWSIAAAAMTEQPRRELTFVAAARKLQSFYMGPALCRIALFPNVVIIPVLSEPQDISAAMRAGRPTDFLPPLSADDVVYTSGAPMMTDEVARISRAAGATCYTDPFIPNAKLAESGKLIGRLFGARDARKKSALLGAA